MHMKKLYLERENNSDIGN